MRRIVLVFLALCSSVNCGYNYCNVSCGSTSGKEHTMCLYPKEGPGPKCYLYENYLFKADEKKKILDKHNELRRSVTKGEVRHHYTALDMVDLIWNDECEQIARRWAQQCDYGHDKCMNIHDGSWTGQNLFKFWAEDGFRDKYLDGVQMWFDEHKLYKPSPGNINPLQHGVHHYTQMVWSRTTSVGCERSFYNNSEYVVCNYHPGGNVKGEMVYEPGKIVNEAVRQWVCFFILPVGLILALKSNLVTGSL